MPISLLWSDCQNLDAKVNLPWMQPVKQDIFACVKCGKTYKRKDTLQRHLTYECKINTDRIKGSFGCDKCGRFYIRKDSLQRHLTYECGKEPQFQCPFCPQKCKRKTHQVRHVYRRHKDQIGLFTENNPDIPL